MLEAVGYLFVLVFILMGLIFRVHLLNEQYAVAFLLASLGWGTLVNVFAVLVGAWRFRYGLADRLQRGLLPFDRKRDVLILLGYAVLENFFWRFLTLYWRFAWLVGCVACKSGWEKFARQGSRNIRRLCVRPDAKRFRILVVDDDPEFVQLVATIVEEAGFGAPTTAGPAAMRFGLAQDVDLVYSTTSSPTSTG